MVDSGRVAAGGGGQGERIFGVEPEAFLPGQDAVDGAAGELAEHGEAAVQQFRGAAELVDDEAADERLIFG